MGPGGARVVGGGGGDGVGEGGLCLRRRDLTLLSAASFPHNPAGSVECVYASPVDEALVLLQCMYSVTCVTLGLPTSPFTFSLSALPHLPQQGYYLGGKSCVFRPGILSLVIKGTGLASSLKFILPEQK